MTIADIYAGYLGGKYIETWKSISSMHYNDLKKDEQIIVNKIVYDTLKKIDYNVNIVMNVLNQNGFEHKNFGNINTLNRTYLLRNPNKYNDLILELIGDTENGRKVPFFFASFCSFFEVIDFRGSFKDIEVDILLDALFIESPNNLQELEERIFDITSDEKSVSACMFSPDQFVKENVSGDIGPCVLLDNNVLIDNSVVNFSEDMPMLFVEYLRFCFEWACFPNLFWATEKEKEPFLSILKEVKENIKPF